MTDHKSFMHKSFPSSSSNAHTAHLKHLHEPVTHEDPNLTPRVGAVGHDGTGPGGMDM